MQAGFSVAYVADAKVIHSHSYTCKQQFVRSFDLGVSQRQYHEIFDNISSEKEQIAAGNFNFIHIISDYVFYEDYEGKTAYYYNISTGENKNFNPTVEKD